MKRYSSQFEKIIRRQYWGFIALLTACFVLWSLVFALWGRYHYPALLAASLAMAAFISIFAYLRHLRKQFFQPLGYILEELGQSSILKRNVGAELALDSPLLPVAAQINRSLDNTNHLVELIENINRDTSFDGILKYIYSTFSVFIPYTHIGIALLQEDGQTLEASYGISGGQLEGLPHRLLGITARLDETSMGNVLKKGEPRIINNLEGYAKKPLKKYNQILLDEGVRSSITLPLLLSGKPVGIIFFSSTVPGIYRQEHVTVLRILANSIAISLNKNIFIDQLLYSGVLALAKLAESRDEETGDHLERMKQYSKMIACLLFEDEVFPQEMNFDLMRSIERFSPMHDIGKVGVRDAVLQKPGKLQPQEYEEMKMHPVYGANVLRAAQAGVDSYQPRLFAIGIEIAESHHEWWDGSGYPYGLKGDRIPLSARVVAVADVLDALTSKRVYKEALTFEQSFDVLLQGSGSQFDPDIIRCLARHKQRVYHLYQHLSDHFSD